MDLQITIPTIQMYPDGRMDAANAARYAGLAPKTLAMMRCSGTGPMFVKRGRIFYFKKIWTNGSVSIAPLARPRRSKSNVHRLQQSLALPRCEAKCCLGHQQLPESICWRSHRHTKHPC